MNHYYHSRPTRRLHRTGLLWPCVALLMAAPAMAASPRPQPASTYAMAPAHELHGTVTGAKDNSPLPGVSIQVQGTSRGTVTGADGHFTLSVNDNDVLVITLMGYQKQTITIHNQTTLHISMAEAATGLDEVLVVGYGTERKKLNTGAIDHVASASIDQQHNLRVDEALQGQTPGIQVTPTSAQPGEPMKVRIRGTGTIGNANPLYIVDGVPTYDISYLNAADIASMDVAKDAASTAIYGARAANGIIFVTTKKGKRGIISLGYDGFYGVQNPSRKLPLLDAHEYEVIMNEAGINSGRGPYFTLDQVNSAGKGTDWQEAMYNKNAPIQSHAISVTGGNDKSVYASSISYMKQEGVIGFKGQSAYDRLNVRFNSEHDMYKDIVKFGENFTYSLSNKSGVGVGNIYANTVRGIVNTSPLFPVYDSAGNFAKSTWNPDETNPIALMRYQNNNKAKTDRLIGNVYLQAQPIKGLTIRSDFGLDLSYYNYDNYLPTYDLSTNVVNNHTRATMGMQRVATWNWDNTLAYEHSFGKHKFNVLAGMSSLQADTFYVNGYKEDLIIADQDHAVINNGTNEDTKQVYGSHNQMSLLSYFGRIGYNYAEKYLVTAVFRADGSSMFGPNNRFGYFPSISAGWVISNEEFAKRIHGLDFLKVRAGWGQNGNLPLLNWAYLATVSSNYQDYYFGSDESKYVGTSPNQIPNPDLKWETSEQANIGIDGQLFRAFTFSVELYNKTTKDWIIQPPVPVIAGTSAPLVNGGSVRNRGVEVMVGYENNDHPLHWRVNGNIGINRNNVIDIPNTGKVIQGQTGTNYVGGDEYYRAQVGHPIGYFYGLKTNGIFQNEKEVSAYTGKNGLIQPNALPGDVRFADLNGDGIIDSNDKTQIGNPFPKFTYGINAGVNYRGVDLSLFFYGNQGQDVYDGIRDYSRPVSNYTTEILGRWTGEGTSNHLPRMTLGDDKNLNMTRSSDLFVHKASFLRIKSINLGYDLKTLFPRMPMQQCRLYVSGLNLYTFTQYKGMDPEIGYGPDSWSSGVDLGAYPQPKSLLVGLNVKF